MGKDKAWVEIGGRALIERVRDRLLQVCDEIILVAGDLQTYSKLEVRVVGDYFSGKGSLGGIYTGLREAQFERAAVVACDMPFLSPKLLEYMLSQSWDSDVVIPSASDVPNRRSAVEAVEKGSSHALPTAKAGHLHPLHAIYSKECIKPIEARLEGNDLRMISFHPDVRVKILTVEEIERFDPEHLSLLNVNTPQDLIYAQAVASWESLN